MVYEVEKCKLHKKDEESLLVLRVTRFLRVFIVSVVAASFSSSF